MLLRTVSGDNVGPSFFRIKQSIVNYVTYLSFKDAQILFAVKAFTLY